MSSLAAALAERLDEPAILARAGDARIGGHAVDGVAPDVVVAPADEAGVSALLAYAHERRLAVVPRGGGTALAFGNPPARIDILLSLERLRGTTYHEPADLVAAFAAGTRLADAARTLADHDQLLPLEPPGAEHGATIGGAVAAGLTGPRRSLFGHPRERLLGVRAVLADGTITRAGGRVTKNVAGFDLPRLYAGSLGALAVVTEATFKVLPRPEARTAIVAVAGDATVAERVRTALMDAAVPLDGIALLDPAALAAAPVIGEGAGDGEGYALVALASGPRARIDRALDEVPAALRGLGAAVATAEDADAEATIATLRDLPRTLASRHDAAARIRASVGPSRALGAAAHAAADAKALGLSAAVCGQAASGVLEVVAGAPSAGPVAELIARLRRFAAGARGSVAVLDAPPAVKEATGDVFGPPGAELPLLRRVKAAFDPAGILAPGRGWGERA